MIYDFRFTISDLRFNDCTVPQFIKLSDTRWLRYIPPKALGGTLSHLDLSNHHIISSRSDNVAPALRRDHIIIIPRESSEASGRTRAVEHQISNKEIKNQNSKFVIPYS